MPVIGDQHPSSVITDVRVWWSTCKTEKECPSRTGCSCLVDSTVLLDECGRIGPMRILISLSQASNNSIEFATTGYFNGT